MTTCHFELRKASARGTDSLIADAMRHLHARQHLGKGVIICGQPLSTLSTGRKQWLKLSRTIQKQRASTLNADKILKYTHTITHMQHLVFSTHTPLEQPNADIFFLHPSDIGILPARCYTVYIATPIEIELATRIVDQMPSSSLIVDYHTNNYWDELHLPPKTGLEKRVEAEWRQVNHYLDSYQIDIAALTANGLQNIEAMDDALDTLLGVSHTFLEIAQAFQRALELARPLRLPKDVRQHYDSFMLLAYRVQALSPGAFTRHFLEMYNEDDTFFLYDTAKGKPVVNPDILSEMIGRHLAAGRHNIAQALTTMRHEL